MSKLLNKYEQLKKNDSSCIYLFRVGIFYNILNKDAELVNKKIGLKLTSLSSDIVKCGFPISSLDKYIKKFDEMQIQCKIIDNLPNNINIEDYTNNIEIKKILKKIKEIDMDNTTFHQAFDILLEVQNKLKKIE